MGHIINYLREETIGKEISNEARIEIEECIHFHLNDLRIVMTRENFLCIADMFIEAKNKYLSMGSPTSMPHMVSLAGGKIGKLLSHNRFGIEHQIDDTFHIHYKNLRIHLNSGDFLGIMNMMVDARNNIPKSFIRDVKISECSTHGIVNDYIKMLVDYDNGMYPKQSPDNMVNLRNDMIAERSMVGNPALRTLGFPSDWPGKVGEDLDRDYLFSLYESIKKYGYCNNAFERRYMWAHDRMGKTHLTGSHRTAVLKHLGYDNIKVFYMSPPSDQI